MSAGAAGGVKAGEAYVVIGADLKPLQDALKSVQEKLNSFTTSIATVGAGMAGIGAAILYPFKVAFGEFTNAEQAQARLAAIVRASGQAAGFSAEEMVKQASALQQVTSYSDEAVMGVQAILSTFKGIKGEQFKNVTELALDLASAMGTDAQTAAMQLGKAMNDPEQGLAALSRAGIQFTDEQKKLIKSLMDSGKVAEAQVMVYDRIKSAVGGTAREMGKTFGAAIEQTKNAIGDLGEEIGAVVAPAIKQFADYIRSILPSLSAWVAANKPLLQGLLRLGALLAGSGAAILAMAGALKVLGMLAGILTALGSVASIAASVITILAAGISALFTPLAAVVALGAALVTVLFTMTSAGQKALKFWGEFFGGVVGAISEFAGAIAAALEVGDIGAALDVLKAAFDAAWAEILVGWEMAKYGLMTSFNTLKGSVAEVAKFIGTAWDYAVASIQQTFSLLVGYGSSAFSTLKSAGVTAAQLFVDGWRSQLKLLMDLLRPVLVGLVEVTKKLGIVSPIPKPAADAAQAMLDVMDALGKGADKALGDTSDRLAQMSNDALIAGQKAKDAMNQTFAALEAGKKTPTLNIAIAPVDRTDLEIARQQAEEAMGKLKVAEAAPIEKRDTAEYLRRIREASGGFSNDVSEAAKGFEQTVSTAVVAASSKLGAGTVMGQFGGAGIEERFALALRTDTDQKILDENKKQTAQLEAIAKNTADMTPSYA